jgi:hypothetical protein
MAAHSMAEARAMAQKRGGLARALSDVERVERDVRQR